MSIIISPKVRLVVSTIRQATFDYLTNEATELALTKDISLGIQSLSLEGRGTTVSSATDRVAPTIATGHGAVSFKFSTYLKADVDSPNIIAAEKLLWESLSATDTVDTTTTSTIAFTSGNTNKLRELYFFIIFENGSYYKVKSAVVNSVTINVDINQPTIAEWDVIALDVNYVPSTPTTGTPKDSTSPSNIIRNKLSTLNMTFGATPVTYNLAILKANLTISNNVSTVNRVRVGQPLYPTGHYVGNRTSKLDLSFYLNNQVDGSASLFTDLINNLVGLTNLTIAELNELANITLSLGGSTNNLKIDINMPNSKLLLRNPDQFGKINSVDISAIPQETTRGAADEINIVYTDTT